MQFDESFREARQRLQLLKEQTEWPSPSCRSQSERKKTGQETNHSARGAHSISIFTLLTPAMQETQIQLLGREDPLEDDMATLSSILAWKIPWTEKPGGLQSMGSQRAGHD